jgi:putative transposase
MAVENLKFKGKYRIPSSRLVGWDYGSPGYYFITLCTKNHDQWFGEVRGERVILSNPGKIAMECLEKIPIIHPAINLDTWVVMPNHVHAIIIREETVETPHWGVSTTGRNWRSGVLGAIINQYKSVCTKRIHTLGCEDFTWQARFYDHIIRDEREWNNIRMYILENPINWTKDEYYSKY